MSLLFKQERHLKKRDLKKGISSSSMGNIFSLFLCMGNESQNRYPKIIVCPYICCMQICYTKFSCIICHFQNLIYNFLTYKLVIELKQLM